MFQIITQHSVTVAYSCVTAARVNIHMCPGCSCSDDAVGEDFGCAPSQA